MEYKNDSEIKPKDIINDPEDNTVYIVINATSGNNPRLVLRNFLTQKVTQRSVPHNKQFLLIEPEIVQFQLNYYNNTTLNVMNNETFEEFEFDGSSLGERLEPLKKAFDLGKNVYIELEKIDTIQNVKNFIIKEDTIVPNEKNVQEQSLQDKKQVGVESQQRGSSKQKAANEKPEPDKHLITAKSSSKESIPSSKPDKPPLTEVTKASEVNDKSKKQSFPPKIPSSPTESLSGTPLVQKAFKGLGDKTFEIFKDEYHINTLEDLINANTSNLAKIPRLNEKKIKEWQEVAKKLLKEGKKK